MSEELAQSLRNHGLQVTAQRIAVLRAIAAQPHCNAEQIAAFVRSEIGTISRQAVYDALASLSDKGLIRKIQPAGSPALYEDRVNDDHHHLICRSCGATVDVESSVGAANCKRAAQDAGFEIEEVEVIFWGRCPQCRD